MATPIPHRPLLPGLYQVVPLGPDRIVVANGGRTVALSGAGFTARVGPLLAALDGTSTAEDLHLRFPEIAPAVLDGLAAKGLLVDAAPVSDRPSVAPQLTAVALPGAPSPAESAAGLAAATVTIFGCGAPGGAVAVLLTKAGVGRLVVADDGAVGEGDLAVSPILERSDVGCPRAEAVARHCRDAGGDAAGVAVGQSWDFRPDVVLLELGYDEVGTAAADHCLAAGLSYLVHTQDALEASVGPFVGPGGFPCHQCLAARRLSHVAHSEEYLAYRQQRATTSPRPTAYLAAQVALVAGLASIEVLRALLDAEPSSAGALLSLDLGGYSARREVLLPVPGCRGCARAGRERP